MSNATEYADSIASGIQSNTDKGAPFGLVNRETEEWTDDAEAFDSWENDEDSPYDEAGGMDYLQDVLDIQYVVSGDRTYRGARICIAFGGPTAWINTMTSQLEVAWWSATEYRELPREFVSGLDTALEELWEMGG